MLARFVYLFVCAVAFFFTSIGSAQKSATTAPEWASAKQDPAHSLIVEAIRLMDANDIDGAAAKLDAALLLNSKSTVAHVLRGSIYASKKLWPEAETDFLAAEKTAPSDIRIKFFLADIKFSKKEYDQARVRYAALEKDAEKGDLASYKVFLCNLLGGHEEAAAKKLAVFNEVMSNPSYYFGNAAWSLYHHDVDGSKSWLDSANRIYPTQKILPYAEPLMDLGYILAKPR